MASFFDKFRVPQMLALETEREALRGSRIRNDALEALPGLLAPITSGDLLTNLDRQGRGSPRTQALSVNPITGEPLSAPDIGNVPGAQAEQQAQLAGVLGQLAPQTVASGVLGPERGLAGKIAALRAGLNREPTEDEILKLAMPGSGGLREDLLSLQVTQLLRDLNKDREEDTTANVTRADGILASLEELVFVDDALGTLEGTILAPGGGGLAETARELAPTAAFVSDLFGDEALSGRISKLQTAYDDLQKGTKRQVGNAIERMNSFGITPSIPLQRLISEMNASENVSPGTIRSINSTIAKELLRDADRQKIDLGPRRGRYEALIQKFNVGTMEFFSEAEANAAIQAGALGPGDEFLINGKLKRVP